MSISSIASSGTNLLLRLPTVTSAPSQATGPESKSLGETPPIRLSLEQIGDLAQLFAPTGFLGRLKKRLNHLKNKDNIVVPADGTVACIDDHGVVYVGVRFLQEQLGREKEEKDEKEKERARREGEEVIAGVLAHEWGHSCAVKPTKEEIQDMNWNQIFEERRAHESLADEISGRLLFMMGYTPKGLTNFLLRNKGDTHTLKYHAPEVRAQIIQYGFEVEKRKAAFAKQLFQGGGYKSQYHSILLDIA